MELSLFLKDKLTIIYHGYTKLYESERIDTVSLLSRKREVISIDKEIFTYLENYLKSQDKLKNLVGFNGSKELILITPSVHDFKIIPEFTENDISIEKRLLQKEHELDSLTWRKSKKEIFPKINFHSSFGSYYSSILKYQ